MRSFGMLYFPCILDAAKQFFVERLYKKILKLHAVGTARCHCLGLRALRYYEPKRKENPGNLRSRGA